MICVLPDYCPFSLFFSHHFNSSFYFILWAHLIFYLLGFPGRSMVEESACHCRRHQFIVCIIGKTPWRRKWQLTPLFLPGESHGLRKLVGYHPWGSKESDDWATEHIYMLLMYFQQYLFSLVLLPTHFFFFFFGPHCEAYGILVPWPEIEPAPPAVEVWSLNHCTSREGPLPTHFCSVNDLIFSLISPCLYFISSSSQNLCWTAWSLLLILNS